jgi:hypothetical protein
MKLCFDEGFSPRIPESLAVFFRDTHEITHTRQKFGKGIKDISQIEALSREKGWIFLSHDRTMTKNKAEQRALTGADMISFYLKRTLSQKSPQKQFQRIITIWDELMNEAQKAQIGTVFEIPETGKIRVKILK